MENSNIIFSIIVPAYKETYLKECIDSILAQTYVNFELIIVNDASPYNLDAIVRQYNDKRIIYYKNHPGIGARDIVKNWNKSLRFATGNYIICMGDDDKLLPNCLQDYLELITKYPQKDLFQSWTQIIDENSLLIGIQNKRPEEESVYSLIWRLWCGDRQFIGDWLFKASSLRLNGGFYDLPYGWASDYITAFQLAIQHGVANTQRPGFQYRENNKTITKCTDNVADKISAMNKAKIWYLHFLESEPSVTEDKIYRQMMINKLDNRIGKKQAYDISERLRAKPLSIFFWLTHIHKLKINLKIVLLACAYAINKHS